MERALTARGQATRDRIVQAAALLIRQNGAGDTTLDDVMAVTSTSKSQLFHYFPDGRSQLLLAVADYEAGQVLESQQPYLGELRTWDDWQQWRATVIDHYVSLGEHCPLGSLTSELGRSTPQVRAVLARLHARWEEALIRGVRAAAPAERDPEIRARSILAAVQGGVVLLRSTGRTEFLDAALKEALAPLAPSGSGC